MCVSVDQQKEFQALCRPVIKFLWDNFHPHVTIIITPVDAQLFEGLCSTGTIMGDEEDLKGERENE